MTNLRKAVEMALEALDVATTPLAKDRQTVIKAQTALRTALAQPDNTSDSATRSADSAESFCKQELHNLMSVAGRMALELECLLLDTENLSVVSKWWDTGMEALQDYRHYVWSVTHGKDGENFCDTHCVHTDHHPDCELAQPEQEPVAWANPTDLVNFDMKVRTGGSPLHTVPLYTAPPETVPLADYKKLQETVTSQGMRLIEVDEQKPVAYWNGKDMFKRADEVQYVVNWTDYYHYPLYSEPVKGDISEPVENLEPVACIGMLHPDHFEDVCRKSGGNSSTPLYTAPPKREWQGLTDEERVQAFVDAGLELAYMDYDADMKISKVIEAKLKEKNT